jgi:hypothetical protein
VKFELCEKQMARYRGWAQKVMRGDEGISPFVFEFIPNGLGDSVVVRLGNQSVDLSMDDDGEFLYEIDW